MRVTVSLWEADLQLILRRRVAGEARLAWPFWVQGTRPGLLSTRKLVSEPAFVAEAAAAVFEVEFTNVAAVFARGIASVSGRFVREEGDVQRHRPHGVGDALVETVAKNGSQR